MRVIGVDPGTKVLGYCILDTLDRDVKCLTSGTILGGSSKEVAYRLGILYRELQNVIEYWKPDTLAIEEPFVAPSRGAKSAILVGQAQSVALILAVRHGISIHRYAPTKVKSLVASYGAGTKQQVQASVRILLGLGDEPLSEDASDAIAIALCHIYQTKTLLSVRT
ncbi:MAG: crossover junction endodeoxyribonuclease RuvC [SAR202 cluster bacterium]|nr:crossover junction endodeoxyribonuclease RuvC [SAR202 cluster bacterium]|tara:strand:+ start:29837 stop:30334 length:498 start_codon:yes stop_codon:yes gene_type:complete